MIEDFELTFARDGGQAADLMDALERCEPIVRCRFPTARTGPEKVKMILLEYPEIVEMNRKLNAKIET